METKYLQKQLEAILLHTDKFRYSIRLKPILQRNFCRRSKSAPRHAKPRDPSPEVSSLDTTRQKWANHHHRQLFRKIISHFVIFVAINEQHPSSLLSSLSLPQFSILRCERLCTRPTGRRSPTRTLHSATATWFSSLASPHTTPRLLTTGMNCYLLENASTASQS